MRSCPEPVAAHIHVHSNTGSCLYYLCPCCGILLPREYMRYCDNCGQRLCWIIHLHCHQKNPPVP